MDLRTGLELLLAVVLTGASAFVIPRTVLRNKRREAGEVAALAARARRRTAQGKARVVTCTPTGWTINDMPQLEVELELSAEGRTVKFTEKVLVQEGVTFDKGEMVSVTFDPLDPTNVDAKF